MNLSENLLATAAKQPENVVIRLENENTTYAQLNEASARVAGLLTSMGVGVGDRVGLMLPNIPEFAFTYYGILRIGAIVVPMNPLLKEREVEYHLTDSGAKVLFASSAMAKEAQLGADAVEGVRAVIVHPGEFIASLSDVEPNYNVEPRAADDTAVILYTSGTTGHPKGAELTHGNLTSNVDVVQDELAQLTPEDVVFAGLPLFHAFGQTVTLNLTVTTGAAMVLLPRFNPEHALELMAADDVTLFAGVPTMFSAFLHTKDAPALPKLRLCISGGAALPVEVLNQFEERFGTVVLEGYGLSETSPAASFNKPSERKAGSVGKPVLGVEMKIIDSDGNAVPDGERGEIAIRGANVMKGYWNKPDATAAVLSPDGWFRTGDVGLIDEEGYFHVVDRMKELIIRGGYNVYPREIEEVLYEHPAVAEAAVIGLPDKEMGEEVAAAVALKPGAETTAEELRTYVKGQVAAYKYPRVVWLVDSLPKGPTGKIVKREIVPPADAIGSNK